MHESVSAIAISPTGHLLWRDAPAAEVPAKRIASAFTISGAAGLLHLATVELQAHLPPALEYLRDFGRRYLTHLCRSTSVETQTDIAPAESPTEAELATLVLQAPPMEGLEYLQPDVLRTWWIELDELVRLQIKKHGGGAQAYLAERNPAWRLVGKVTFHLAENKRDADRPFAFLATFASKLSAQGKVQHEPLGTALQRYAGAKNKLALLTLLVPIQRAAERSELARDLIESGEVYQPRAWSPREAYRFLQDIPVFEESGLIVRVPDWWKASRPSRPIVDVTVNRRGNSSLGADALLEFSVNIALNGEALTKAEVAQLLAATSGLVQLKGQWVEVDREKLQEALAHWQSIESDAHDGGITFFEGMRLLAGAPIERDTAADATAAIRDWVGLTASPELAETLQRLRSPDSASDAAPPGLHAELRPYQRTGVSWLRFTAGLGLGACLADDMGLGKTIQVIGLLLHHKRQASAASPSLLVAPASLLGNWKAELQRFAPTLAFMIVHPSEMPDGLENIAVTGCDLVITTYGMASRLDWLRNRAWQFVILDEAQAIKNSGTRQAKAVKELKATARIALTGTPIENRLGDLWSLFDFLNPGLLGGAKAFKNLVKKMEASQPPNYGPLRTLVQPYILRRLKTDKQVIADLPDKTEMRAYCSLSRQQAVLYEQSVNDLRRRLDVVDGMQRRGLILSQLMRLKQICNHPVQLLGAGDYDPVHSGKFQRLGELGEELAARQEKALVFTQFREITEPLARFLAGVFGRPGLVLHGGTAVVKRRGLVEQFQREDGPPFFVLSVKAGGTGLNLTAASHVIHFDRWWNPAVENQATDRAFRIGQTRNVMVHKFVCRGTLEEKIDALIEEKAGLANELLEGGETLLTEMDDKKLLAFVALEINKALDS